MTFVIKGYEFDLYGEDYIITANGDSEDDPGKHSDEVDDCELAIMPLDVPSIE